MLKMYAGKRVLVTGDSGFVGTWLCKWLSLLGANVLGVSLPHDVGLVASSRVVIDWAPDIVFHLAAQALVADSYRDPIWTLQTNVMGAAHVLEGVRQSHSVQACVVVTSDKCYAPSDTPYRENSQLGGDDPYSASKGAAELVAHAYCKSFGLPIATARAGNIVGGGDWSHGRLVPDCIRAARSGDILELRQPFSVRPWQHVLDAVCGYLMLGAALAQDDEFCGPWNFGPDDAISVSGLVAAFGVGWKTVRAQSFPEASYLWLDSSKSRARLGWRPLLSRSEMVSWTLDHYATNYDLTVAQILQYSKRLS